MASAEVPPANTTTTTPPETEKAPSPTKKHILVLGASYTGLSVAHYLLRHVVPALSDKSSYHVTLVDPSTSWLVFEEYYYLIISLIITT